MTDHDASPLSYDPKVMASLKEAVGDAVGSLIEAFQEDMVIYLDNLSKAIKDNDALQIRHFGARELVKHSKELEDRTELDDTRDAAVYAERIATAFSALTIDLDQEVSLVGQIDKVSVSSLEQRYRILVVDDDRSLRLLLVNAFKREDYELEEATNGAQAIEICQRRMPDLILMDAVMPEMDGFDACQAY